MNKSIQVLFGLSLLTLFVIVLLLNVQQHAMYNDDAMTVVLNKGYANEKDFFSNNEATSKPYQHLKPRKSSSNYANSNTPSLHVDLNNPEKVNARSAGRQPVSAFGNTGGMGSASMGLSYNNSTTANTSNGGFSVGAGASAYGGKRSGNSSNGSGAGGGSLNARLIADRSALAGQSALFAPLVPGAGSTTILVDPSTDPTEAERIPVGDGLGLLALFALLYAARKLYVSLINVN